MIFKKTFRSGLLETVGDDLRLVAMVINSTKEKQDGVLRDRQSSELLMPGACYEWVEMSVRLTVQAWITDIKLVNFFLFEGVAYDMTETDVLAKKLAADEVLSLGAFIQQGQPSKGNGGWL